MPRHVGKLVKYKCLSCEAEKSQFEWLCDDCRRDVDPPSCCDNPAMVQHDQFSRLRTRYAEVHPSERLVYWESADGKEIRVPMRNDVPMPQKYAEQGYQRVECKSIQDIMRMERKHNKISEKLHYDDGSGTRRPDWAIEAGMSPREFEQYRKRRG